MGHSLTYMEATQLAGHVLCLMQEKPGARKCLHLKGLNQDVELWLWQGNLRVTFERGREKRILVIVIGRGRPERALDHPQTWRRAERKELRESLDKKGDPGRQLPFLARHMGLVVDDNTTAEELTLQILSVWSKWGWGELSEPDFKSLANYVQEVVPHTGEKLAGQVATYLITNWLDPETASGFRGYIKQAAWALRVQNRSQVRELIEDEHPRSGRRKSGTRGQWVPLPHLALRAGLSCRRVYELVKAGKIPSEKKGATRAVDAETAQKLVKEKNERRRIRDLIQEVIQRGVKKDAVRKRVYRLRRAGRTDAEIAQELLKLLM